MKYKLTESDDPYQMIKSDFLKYLASDSEIQCIYLNCKGIPTNDQVHVMEKIHAHGEFLFNEILKNSILSWDQQIDEDELNGDFGFSKINRPIEMSDYLEISGIYIHNDLKINDYTTVGFSGTWALDDEHGYGITFKYLSASNSFHFVEIGDQDLSFGDEAEYYDFNSRSEILAAVDSIKKENEKILNMVKAGTWKMGYSAQDHVRDSEEHIKSLLEYCNKWFPE